jgi:hypothetical protein
MTTTSDDSLLLRSPTVPQLEARGRSLAPPRVIGSCHVQARPSQGLYSQSQEVLRKCTFMDLCRAVSTGSSSAESPRQAVGVHLQQAQNDYSALDGTRTRQLERQLDEIDRLRELEGIPIPLALEDASGDTEAGGAVSEGPVEGMRSRRR